MDFTYKTWENKNYYNFSVEFNRIESYNEYCKYWLNNYYGYNLQFESKTNWTINDIVDLQDFNRVKSNINMILNIFDLDNTINISTQLNQTFNYNKANEIEQRLKNYLEELGKWQLSYNITGLTTTGGNNLKLVG